MAHSAGRPSSFEGRRILVVEDLFVVAEELADQLRELGCTVIGPVGSLAAAWVEAKRPELENGLDGALLDIDLGGETSFPLADFLAARNVPYAFVTAYDRTVLPLTHRSAPILMKPLDQNALYEVILSCFCTTQRPSIGRRVP